VLRSYAEREGVGRVRRASRLHRQGTAHAVVDLARVAPGARPSRLLQQLMNPTHLLRREASAWPGNWRPAGPVNFAVAAVIALPVPTAIRGVRLGLNRLYARRRPASRSCANRGAPVTERDPLIRYRGDYTPTAALRQTPRAQSATRSHDADEPVTQMQDPADHSERWVDHLLFPSWRTALLAWPRS
jgi:hypothetical protein